MTKVKLKKIMGENIRNERVARNLSIDELAELLGLTPGFVGLIERGKRGATAYTLHKLSRILDIPMDQLFNVDNQVVVYQNDQNPIEMRRTKLNSIIYDLNEIELDFIISVIKNLKTMQNNIQGNVVGEDEDDDEEYEV